MPIKFRINGIEVEATRQTGDSWRSAAFRALQNAGRGDIELDESRPVIVDGQRYQLRDIIQMTMASAEAQHDTDDHLNALASQAEHVVATVPESDVGG